MEHPTPARWIWSLRLALLASISLAGGQAAARTRAAGACTSCHPVAQAAFVHGPVAVKQCQVCHVPHRAAGRSKPVADVPQLCFRCHEAKRFAKSATRPAHTGRCTTCHDPHGGPRRFLLRASAQPRPAAPTNGRAASAGASRLTLARH